MDKRRTDATLELIDNALAGSTSADAMRWTPDPDEAAAETAGAQISFADILGWLTLYGISADQATQNLADTIRHAVAGATQQDVEDAMTDVHEHWRNPPRREPR